MYNYIVAGRTRQGKSRYVKEMITHPQTITRPLIVFDPQNEYGNFYKTIINGVLTWVPGPGLPEYKPGLRRSRFCGSFEDFVNLVSFKKTDPKTGNLVRAFRGYTIVFDESTIYLKGGIPAAVRDLVISRFHDLNNLVFVFHKLKTIPPDLMDFSNYVILFKTFDTEINVKTRFDDELLTYAFLMQKKKPDGSPACIINRLNNTIDGKQYEF